MDTTLILLSILTAAVAALGFITYRLIKSLEFYLIPLYAELVRKRERDYVLIEFLTSLLVSKGLITDVEARALRNVAATGPLTMEDLDRVDEILEKDPTQLTLEEILDVKKVAYKLLGRLDKKSLKLGMKLLRYVANVEEALLGGMRAVASRQTEKVEMSYDHESCTVYLVSHKRDGTVEKAQGPDIQCVTETIAVLRALARRSENVNKELAEKALARYSKCKESDAAGCKALREALGPLEKKSLDILLTQKNWELR
jgi:hypothetical protein